MTFDRSLTYQFVLFFSELPEELDAAKSKAVAEVMSESRGRASLGMKFGVRQIGLQSEQRPGQAASLPIPASIWQAGSGIWRLSYIPSRIDLIFDARGYEDIAGQAVSLATACERVVPSLLNLPDVVERLPSRMALVVTGQASEASLGIAPTRLVSRRYFKESITGNDSDLRDLSARINSMEQWQLGEIGVLTNRIEAATVEFLVSPPGEKQPQILTWQTDVNTSGDELLNASRASLQAFFTLARSRIEGQLTSLQGDSDVLR